MSGLRRLRTALVGAGLVGQAAHAVTLAEDQQRFDLVAVVDPSPSVRAAVAARHGVPHAVASLAEALALGLDAVVIAVPDPAHKDTIVAALQAGVHAFCEKPLALSLGECDDIIAARGDLVVQCGYMKLYDPAVERAAELVAAASEVVYLSVEVNDPDQGPFVEHLELHSGTDVPQSLVTDSRSRLAQAVAAARGATPSAAEARAFEAFFSALVHDVSLAHHLLGAAGIGAPLATTDAAWFDGGRGVSLGWSLPGGGRANLEHLNLPGVPEYRERVSIYCRDRVVELTFPAPYLRHHPTRLVERLARAAPAPGTELTTVEHRVSYEEAFRAELRAFHSSVTTGAPVRASAERAREDVAALLAAFALATSNHHASE